MSCCRQRFCTCWSNETAQKHNFRLRVRLDLPIEVVPVSTRWSDRVDPKELDGKPAELLSNAVDRLARDDTSFCSGPSFSVQARL